MLDGGELHAHRPAVTDTDIGDAIFVDVGLCAQHVDRATLTFRLGAEEAERQYGEVIPLDLMATSKRTSTRGTKSSP